jgi:hypothetical protein
VGLLMAYSGNDQQRRVACDAYRVKHSFLSRRSRQQLVITKPRVRPATGCLLSPCMRGRRQAKDEDCSRSRARDGGKKPRTVHHQDV